MLSHVCSVMSQQARGREGRPRSQALRGSTSSRGREAEPNFGLSFFCSCCSSDYILPGYYLFLPICHCWGCLVESCCGCDNRNSSSSTTTAPSTSITTASERTSKETQLQLRHLPLLLPLLLLLLLKLLLLAVLQLLFTLHYHCVAGKKICAAIAAYCRRHLELVSQETLLAVKVLPANTTCRVLFHKRPYPSR